MRKNSKKIKKHGGSQLSLSLPNVPKNNAVNKLHNLTIELDKHKQNADDILFVINHFARKCGKIRDLGICLKRNMLTCNPDINTFTVYMNNAIQFCNIHKYNKSQFIFIKTLLDKINKSGKGGSSLSSKELNTFISEADTYKTLNTLYVHSGTSIEYKSKSKHQKRTSIKA